MESIHRNGLKKQDTDRKAWWQKHWVHLVSLFDISSLLVQLEVILIHRLVC